MPTAEIQLHDIKPLMEIQEYSLYYFIALVVVGTILLISLVYLAIKWFKNRNKFNLRAEHSRLLKEISFQNPKRAAYDITFYGLTFRDDSERHRKAYELLVEELEAYKYKKDVTSFSDEAKHLFDIYLGLIDV